MLLAWQTPGALHITINTLPTTRAAIPQVHLASLMVLVSKVPFLAQSASVCAGLLQCGTLKAEPVRAAGGLGLWTYEARCCAPSWGVVVTGPGAKMASWSTWITKGPVREFGIRALLPSSAWMSDLRPGDVT